MKSRGLIWCILLGGLVCPALPHAQTVSVLPIDTKALLGTWLGSSVFKQPDVEMTTDGSKSFVSSVRLEDRLTTSIVLKHHSAIPVVLGVRLESDWKLIRDGAYLCETLKRFSVSVISKPDDNALAGGLVAQFMEQMQSGFKAQVAAKKPNCNAIQRTSPDTFALKDGQSGLITQFKRVK